MSSSPSGRFTGRTALVTGAARGIGRATCRAFAAAGATVAAVDIDADGLGELAAELGGRSTAHEADVTDPAQVTAMAAAVHDAHGAVDVLVNNVGHWVRVVPFHLSDPAHWDDLHAVNLRQAYLVTRACIGGMLERGSGVIVNVSSVEGVRAYPNDPVYAAAKAGLNHFTTSMALAYGRRGIRVVAVAPDITNTSQVPYDDDVLADPRWSWWAPLGRPGTPDDQADVIVALASDDFRFVTGAVLNTDGGTVIGGGWSWDDHARRFVNRPEGLRSEGLRSEGPRSERSSPGSTPPTDPEL